jgi:hypothetical protein
VPDYRLRLLIVHLAVGWYETQTIPTITYVMGFFTDAVEKRDLRATLNDIVMAKCGLSDLEADQCFEKYFDDVIVRLQQAELAAHGRLIGIFMAESGRFELYRRSLRNFVTQI